MVETDQTDRNLVTVCQQGGEPSYKMQHLVSHVHLKCQLDYKPIYYHYKVTAECSPLGDNT